MSLDDFKKLVMKYIFKKQRGVSTKDLAIDFDVTTLRIYSVCKMLETDGEIEAVGISPKDKSVIWAAAKEKKVG